MITSSIGSIKLASYQWFLEKASRLCPSGNQRFYQSSLYFGINKLLLGWDLMKMLIVSLCMTGVDNAGILVPDLITYGYLTQNILKKKNNVNLPWKLQNKTLLRSKIQVYTDTHNTQLLGVGLWDKKLHLFLSVDTVLADLRSAGGLFQRPGLSFHLILGTIKRSALDDLRGLTGS